MRKVTLSRRTFLRGLMGGAAVSVALPALDLMFNGSKAYADGGAPRRFGVWFWGNGIRRAYWIPAATGTAWMPGEELQPLADLRPYVSVVSGLEIKTATHPHHSGMAGIMTGAAFLKLGVTRDTIVSTFAQKSVDQVAADAIGGQTQFRSLELGITRFRGSDEGTTFQHLSHNGPNNVNPSEYSAARLFGRLFGTLPTPQVNAARKSVLDVVTGQVRALQGTLGAHDRARLDQHLSSIRGIEMRLQLPAAACATPPAPGDVADVMGNEQIDAQNKIMSDLLAVALACDLTRVFSVMFSTCGSGVIFWEVGAQNGMHLTCHTEPMPQPTVHKAVVFTMGQLGYFLRRLRDTPERGGNLLDNCSILCTTELSEGNTHTNDEFPVLVAGRAGGHLRGGFHYRSPSKENTSKALLTVLRAAGLPLTQFGYDAGLVTDGISAIEM